MATKTDAMSEAQLMNATFEHVRNVLDTAEIGGEIVMNDIPAVIVDRHETETLGRTCVSILAEHEHDDGQHQRYRIGATDAGRHADADVRFQRVIEHDDGRIDHTDLELDTLALGDEDAIEPPTASEQAVTDGGTDTDTVTAAMSDATPTTAADAGPTIDTDDQDDDPNSCPECGGDIYLIEHTIDAKTFRCVACDHEFDGESDAHPAVKRARRRRKQSADTGEDTQDDTDDTDQLDDADMTDDLGDTHWDVAEAISSADGGLTIRQLVEEHVETKKPWTQRCARDLCDAGIVRRERDGRAYVYHMATISAES